MPLGQGLRAQNGVLCEGVSVLKMVSLIKGETPQQKAEIGGAGGL